jgi:hypothetical protein
MAFRTGSTSSSNQQYFENNSDQNTLSTEWKKFSNTYTITVVPHSSNLCLGINIRSRNSNNSGSTPAGNISVTGVQLEVGNIATPFEHRSYGEELALCQRYTYVLNATTDQHNFVGTNYTTTAVYYKAQFPVVMRTAPTGTSTMTVNTYSAGSTIASGASVSVNNTSTLTSQLTNTISGTQGYVSHIDVASGQIIFNAEL